MYDCSARESRARKQLITSNNITVIKRKSQSKAALRWDFGVVVGAFESWAVSRAVREQVLRLAFAPRGTHSKRFRSRGIR